MPGRRLFDFERVKRPTDKRLRLIIARYVRWTEVFGYLFCFLITAGIIVCWIWKVDEIAAEKDRGKTLIKPHEEAVTATKECVVTRVLVREWEAVKQGQPLVEVCEDPVYVHSFKIRQQREAFATGMRALEKTAPLPREVLEEVTKTEQWIASWDAGPREAGPRRQVTAPVQGEVVGTKDLEGKIIPAGQAILRIVNFRDLRLAVILSGPNVERVRVGMPAKIEIQPRYGKNANVRVDIGFWRRRRMQIINTFDDEKLRNFLGEWWKDRDLATRDDRRWKIALRPTAVNELEVVISARGRQVSRAVERAAPEQVKLDVDHLIDRKDLRGTIISGKHTATYQTTFLSPEERRDVRDYLWTPLRKRIGVIREKSGKLVPVELRELRKLRVIVKLKAELAGPDLEALEKEVINELKPGAKPPRRRKGLSPESGVELGPTFVPHWAQKFDEVNRLWESRAEEALEVVKVDRFFEGTIRMLNPPKELEETVRLLAKQDPPAYLNARVMAIVQRRPVAMLLFKQ